MSKFIPSPDLINSTQKKRARKSFSDQKGSLFHELRKVVKESYDSDAFAGVGNMQAIVLAKVDAGDPSKQAWKHPLTAYSYHVKNKVPDFIEIRYRVPELHAHLPEPKDANDHKAINLHPLAIIKKDKGLPEVGDIVTLDFADKVNFTGAMVVETFNSENPPNSGGGMCTPAGTFNSANAPLNVAAPEGDSLVPKDGGAKNNPASQGFKDGIKYPNSQEYIDSFDPITGETGKRVIKRAIYNISIDNFNTMPLFTNETSIIKGLSDFNIFSVCFTVADRGTFLGDKTRLSRIIKNLNDHNIDVSILIREKSKKFNEAILYASRIARTNKIKTIFIEIHDIHQPDDMARIDASMRNLCNSVGSKYGVVIKENYIDSSFPSQQDYTFLAANKYDYSKRDDSVAAATLAKTVRENLQDMFEDTGSYPMYYLGGINLIKTPDEPCVQGARTSEILANEILPSSFTAGASYYFFDLIENLDSDISKIIVERTTGLTKYDEAIKQSLLNSMFDTEAPNKANVEDIANQETRSAADAAKESGATPSFNSEEGKGGSQSAKPTEAAPFSSAPGAQCPPQSGGPQPQGAGGGTPGPAVQAPSFRFDSIENYQNLGWTADPGAAINNVIFEFMEKFSAAVYRRLPQTSPSFTGSNPKKIRLTSTARTYEKQVYLMWDKMRKQGDHGVTSVYGKKKTWVKTVMRTYREGGSPQTAEAMYSNPKFAEAVEAVRVRVEVDGGGSPHLKGRGVDVHTFSHLRAEGIEPHTAATIAQMKSSKYVQAIIAACAEVGGKPLVENYQQHVHIGIL